jgi:hypothetical protein
VDRAPRRLVDSLLILPLTVAAIAVMGYHPGLEDDGIYLSAVKAAVNPALYPHDADFVRLQVQATLFDEFVSGFVRLTHLPVAWTELLGQFLALYTILWAGYRIAQRLFAERQAQWAGVALLAAMFTLPVAGTALNLADQHLHPRTLATALILTAIDRVLARRIGQAVVFLLIAMLMHPIMAALGISFCFFLAVALTDSMYARLTRPTRALPAVVPLGWIFEPPTPEWRRALGTRTYYFLYQWRWYEWLGAIGPLVLFWILWRWADRMERRPSGANAFVEDEAAIARLKSRLVANHGRQIVFPQAPTPGPVNQLGRFCFAILVYGVFQQAVAMILLAAPGMVRVTPLQPMRYLHLVYVFLVLIAGGLLGRHVLKRRIWRWAALFIAAGGGMFVSQRLLLPASAHLELPGRAPGNPWLEAFAWIRQNTPADAYFALDPDYLAASDEDYHSFRALAERSQLADGIKDAAVVTQVPELGPRWSREVDAQAGWNGFGSGDFERLKARFGVDWVLVSNPAASRLTCEWHNDRLSVCRITADRDAPRR